MRVIVSFEDAVWPSLTAWRRSLSDDPDIRKALATAYIDEFKARIVRAGGRLSDAVTDRTKDPPWCWCELTGGTWLAYTIETSGRYFARQRVIRVWEAGSGPSRPAPPATPPS